MKYIKKLIKEYQSIDKVILILFFASIIALPSNLAKTWQPAWSFYQGIFIEYWAPKMYLSQILLLSVFLLALLTTFQKKKDISSFFITTFSKAKNRLFSSTRGYLFTLLVLFILTKSTFAEHPERFFVWFIMFLFGPVILYIIAKKKRFLPYFPYAVLASTSIQAAIGGIQYLLQKNLFPYLVLGETQFDSLLFLAKSTLSDNVRILPYGTTPHPNILGGWLVLGIISLLILRKDLNKIIFTLLLTLQMIVLTLTESFSAWATLLILGTLYFRQRKQHPAPGKIIQTMIILMSAFFWTSLPVLLEQYWPGTNTPTSISRRAQPIRRLVSNPPDQMLFGTGLGQAFPQLNSSQEARSLWKYPQPLHNSGIILISEIGICALLLLLILYALDVNSYSFIFLTIFTSIPIFYLDHYTTTQISGQYIIVIGLIFLSSLVDYLKPRILEHS